MGTVNKMHDVIWNGSPKLRSPIMVCAFKGWNDAGEAATAAVSFIRESVDAEDVGRIDPEEFFDFTAVRPTIRLTEGRTREIDWPEATISAAAVPGRRRRPGGARGHRAVTALAPLHRERDGRRARAGRAQGDHARRPAGRRAAQPPGVDHRPGLRRGARGAARLPAHQLRGPDGHRGRDPPRLRAGRRAVREPLGVGAALRGRRAQPEGGAGARARLRGRGRGGGRGRASSRARPRTTSAR